MNLIYGSAKALNVILCEKDYRSFHVVSIKPYKDGTYKESSCYVDINSKLIDKETVETYAGMINVYDVEEFAVACVDFYGEAFWGAKSAILSKEEAETEIKKLLDIETLES